MISEFINYKGISIHYKERGKGRALVFLHGFLENLEMWETLISTIKPSYRIICIDLLGHGKTDSLAYVHTMDDMAEAVKAVLDHLKLRRYVVFGHSMGGYVSLALANKFPKSIIGLGLLNSTTSADSEEKKQNRTRAITAVKKHRTSFIAESIKQLFWIENHKKLEPSINKIQNQALNTGVQGIIAALEGMKVRSDLKHVIADGKIKTLIVTGTYDTVIDQKHLSVLKPYLNGEFHELEGGHMSHVENIKEFSYIISSFVEKL
ncbi:alpha/beta fold hydrolase [Paucihalobacter sp.]|uniref:alpha/beta fold hydrolase n=1 Tax=Paucihalobacter sp. TaxID=2850405 RepID=UPI002FE23CE7